jgi:hypothetical protein
MGVIRKTGAWFGRSLGYHSTRDNVKASLSRSRAALSMAKGMVSSMRKEEREKGEGVGQFIKLTNKEERTMWLKVASSELAIWILVLFGMLAYFYYYGINIAALMVMLAIIARASLVGVQLSQVLTQTTKQAG